MKNTTDNEAVLIGKVIPGIQHIAYNRKNACLLKIKIDDKYLSNTIPITLNLQLIEEGVIITK